MKLVKAWEVEGVMIKKPFSRRIKILFAPDVNGVAELNFNFALIEKDSQTDYHTHDRGELIYIVSGKGIAVCDDVRSEVGPDVVLWVEKGEKHQMINTGDEILKLATVFTPPYLAKDSYARCESAAEDGK